MKLLVLSESQNHVSCRYRVQAFEPALRAAGWSVSIRPLAGADVRFLDVLREARRSDAVLVQLLRRCARRLVYDFDDALFLRDSNHRKPAWSWRRRSRFREMASACDAVIAGNAHLADCTTQVSRKTRVVVIPTCVRPNLYTPDSEREPGTGLRIAWIGSRSTLASLQALGPALRAAGHRIPGLELHVICDRFPDLPGVKVVRRQWSQPTEAAHIARCDVGISWLPEHPWSRGKCGLKVLQYMAAGLPVIVNSFGVHREIVADGTHGLLIATAGDLIPALARLAADPELRSSQGKRGRQRVEAEYSVARWSDTFLHSISGRAGSERIAS